jgi:hypothetical protein
MYFANSKTPRKPIYEAKSGFKPVKNTLEAYHADGRPFRYIDARSEGGGMMGPPPSDMSKVKDPKAQGEGMGMGAAPPRPRRERIPLDWGASYGWPAKVSPASFGGMGVSAGMGPGIGGGTNHVYLEPIHAHRESHQINMYLGSNRLDIQEFDAEIDIFLGKEHEKHTHNSCSVNHMPPGLIHMSDEVRRVGKPYVNFMFVIGPYMSNYYEAATKDKVQFGDPAKGEVMIPEGASDYVPPTKMEDWVWPYPKK